MLESHHPPTTARDLVREIIQAGSEGDIISVKATIATLRGRAVSLDETDCQIVELVVEIAPVFGMFVAFDLKE
ncbi:hypothetical protein [Mesorhizobium huakuii]|uniref:Uncharacterized protein n=1 Tax=Mesorhizobium huakuii TaxID=28104 RepID=A0ABZ0VTQ8_9HYPH|nr:hypothetical protein [Mesorhizobium huakuii]WQB99659.1 hypothetical protein U0R22_003847 [Mesorhizobium huakuii]